MTKSLQKKNYNTTKDFSFKALNITTGEETSFTLKDLIFNKNTTLIESLHEDMEYVFLGEI